MNLYSAFQGMLPFLVTVALFYFVLKWLMSLKTKGMEDYLSDLAERDPERLELETAWFRQLTPSKQRLHFLIANQTAHFISYKIDWVAYVLLSEHVMREEAA